MIFPSAVQWAGRTTPTREVLVRSEQLLADLKEHVTEADFRRAWSHGQILDLAALEALAAEAPDPAMQVAVPPEPTLAPPAASVSVWGEVPKQCA